MKCTNRIKWRVALLLTAVFLLSGCGSKDTVSYENPYDLYKTSISYGIAENSSNSNINFFAKDLCVADDINFGLQEVHSEVAGAAGTFNLETGAVTYAQNIYDKMYPASTTKIMTCYLALKYGNLDESVTVSEYAANQPSDASVCHVKKGDVLTLRDLLYGLMLASGNDAAIAIAEHISGSEEAFVALMNQEALAIGASCTSFQNPHGMPAEEHYTSVYDLYLMFANAAEYEDFIRIINAESYTAAITDATGKSKELTWENTNRFISGRVEEPEGITILGGKTGTTGEAGYCLVLLAQNSLEQSIVSVVLKAGGPSDLYLLSGEILSQFNK